MARSFRIRAGTIRDASTVYTMLKGLAKYERLLDHFHSSPARVRRDGFGPRRWFRTLICRNGQTPVGIAVYFFTYSTFEARPTLYVEDVFVWPRHRGKGAGTALLAALARIAVQQSCGRIEHTRSSVWKSGDCGWSIRATSDYLFHHLSLRAITMS